MLHIKMLGIVGRGILKYRI